ncbi:MAG: glycosyltransferase family 4 protein [Clostridia bacterium]|nr:glycosyltransferase family 4 protein [Clostridia bacterium]
MKVAVVTDLHFVKDKNGDSYTPVMYGYEFFKRYHNVFEEVCVVARGESVDVAPENSLKVNGEGVETVMMPATLGIKEYAQKYFKLRKAMKDAIKNCDTVIIRTPSALSTMAVSIAKSLKKPFALEVVADPGSVKVTNSLKDKLIRSYIVKSCKDACMTANGVAYVTKYFLQSICPCRATVSGKDTDEYFTGNYSSVTLPLEYYSEPKKYTGKKSFKIVHTANIIGSEAKGHSVVIRTVAKLREKGFDVSVCFVGDGALVPTLKELAETLGIAEHVVFAGKFADPSKVRKCLLDSDIYMLPSESEGLPRGVIEAMACGLVAIASNVSGIPELLDERDMKEPKDVDGYAERIAELLSDPEEMEKASIRNIEVAKNYSSVNLTINRNDFYVKLKRLVEKKQKN